MKKHLLFLILSLIVFSSYAQVSIKTPSNSDQISFSNQSTDDNIIHRIGSNTDNILGYVFADFETATYPPTGWTIEYTGTLYWTREITASGYGNGIAATKFNCWSASSGIIQSLISGTFSASVPGDSLSFDLAYSPYNTSPDQIEISTSTDGGTVYTVLVLLNPADLATCPPSTLVFTPTATQWGTKKYALPAGTNKIKIKGISGYGNNIWLDNIKIGTPPPNDAGTISIDVANTLISGMISPKATFKNLGSASISNLSVTFKITPGTYSSTKTITSLAPGAASQVTFDNWAASAGNFTLKAYTSLPGDANTTNDTLTSAVTVMNGIANYCGWINLPSLPSGKWAYASAYVRRGTAPNDTGFVYVIAGADAAMALSTEVIRLNLKTNTWQIMAPIPVAIYQVSAVAVGNKIYVPGGYSGNQTAVNTLYIYDIPSNTWSTGPTMTQGVGDYAIGTYNNKIYVFEGRNSPTSYNLVQVFDINTNTWSTTTPVPGAALAGIRGSIANNTIILTGGYDNLAGGPVSLTSKGIINGDGSITWSTVGNYPAGTVSRHSGGTPFVYTQPNSRYVLFTGGDPTGLGVAAINATYAWDTQVNQWVFAGTKPTGVSNLDNFVGIMRNDSLYMVSFGGYNGSSVTSVAEAIGIGPESQIIVPVELTSFNANVNSNEVHLNWTTATEINNKGFSIVRKSGNGSYEEVAFVSGKGTTVEPSIYSFIDKPAQSGRYSYALRQVDFDGTSTLSKSIEVDINIVNQYSLDQNYPNPFNPSTMIKFSLAVDSKVTLKIFNIIGEVLYSSNLDLNAGSHSIEFNGAGISSGIYFYQLEARGVNGKHFSSVKKMTLLK